MNATPSEPLIVETFAPQRPTLRVALVTETYPPEVNGVALTLERLVHGLQQRQHQIQLVRPRQAGPDAAHEGAPPPHIEQVLMRGLPIPRYPHLRMGLPAKKALLSLWTRQRPDIVHVATEGPLGWSALQAARKLKLPVSTDFRTNFHAYSRHYGIGWLHKPIAAYLRKFHNLADCTMVPTAALRHELQAIGFERMLVVARGVEVQRFDPARRNEALRHAWGVGPREQVVLSVGRLAPEKNLGLLMQSFRAMRQVNPLLRLVVVGDGPESTAFRHACPEAWMAGSRTGTDLADHYASADMFLFPSVTETYGNVTPEALASGLAVVAYDYAAASELIVHGRNGLLASMGDEAEFIRQACELVANPAQVARLRQAARDTTLSLDWCHIVGHVEDVWARLRQLHAAGPDALKSDWTAWQESRSGAGV